MNTRIVNEGLRERIATKQVSSFQRGLDVILLAPPGEIDASDLVPDYWQQRRRPPRPADRALKGSTLDWLIKLPPQVRPHNIVDRYARVVNQLADAWHDPLAIKACFDDLLYDKRPGRKGFPAVIKRELKILRFHHSTSPPK